jgi:aspartyl-tRNA(Asn)/glutamyl-tRNA(Gln) amidotransferase subunit A
MVYPSEVVHFDAPIFPSLTNTSRLLAQGKLSPFELAQQHIARIDAVDPGLNCFITATPESALAEARAAEESLGRGEQRGPLHGIPLALKDLIDTRSVRTTAGSTFFAERVPDADAAAVERLRQAGAVLLGKLNMHEWALGVTNDNPHFGACRNPWARHRITGGSSGGSAAALAAGLCMGSLGSDTGGSIRIPAALCGVVGLKPTFGRVSVRGVVPLSWNLDHVGPMARHVSDVALLLQAIAGFDPRDPYSVDVAVDDYVSDLARGVEGWRASLASEACVGGVDGEVGRAVREAAKVFAGLGASVEEVDVPRFAEAARANGLMTTADAAVFHRERLAVQPDGFGADVLSRLRRGGSYTAGEYVDARRLQSVLKRELATWFQECGLLLLPTTPIAAPVRDGLDAVEAARVLTRFTAPFNLTGLPAISLPCGFTRDGLPIGLQIVGPAWSEARLLRAAHAYESATPWHRAAPQADQN